MSRDRELEQRIQGLEWQEFERLVYDLIHAEHQDAYRQTPPDSGADVVVPSDIDNRPAVFQVKHYPRTEAALRKCEESLRAALTLEPASVTFVFSRDLSAKRRKIFNQRLAEPFPEVQVRFWTLSNLRALLHKHPAVRESHFPDAVSAPGNIESLVRAINNQTRIERLFGLGIATSDDDPNFTYEILYSEERPPPPLNHEPAVTIDVERDGRYLRLTARRRPGSEGLTGVWKFTDDDAGAAAKHEAMCAVGGGQTEVTIESGFDVQLTRPPKRLVEAWSLIPPEQRQQMRMRFTPGPGIPITLIAVGAERLERHFTVYPFPPIDGFDRAYVGLDRGVMPLMCFRLPEPPRVELGFQPLFDLRQDAAVNAEATSFVLALFRAQAIELVGPFFPEGRITMPAEILRGTLSSELVELVEFWNWLNSETAYIEKELGVTIPVHPPPYDQEEVDTLASSADTLRTRSGQGQFREATAQAQAEMVEVETRRLESHPPVVFPVVREVLGTPVQLGHGLAALPDVRVVALPSLLMTPTGQVKLKIVARSSGDVDFRLLDPGEEPPPGALRTPGFGNEIHARGNPPQRTSGLWIPPGSVAA